MTLELSDPVVTALEPHEWATLAINDPEDQSRISLVSSEIGRAHV